jgi:hypothetical protein
MKALTVWQPWASLIMIGAKPFEFRGWDFRTRGVKVGERIVIHAGARPIKPAEVLEIWGMLNRGSSLVITAKARPLIQRLMDSYKCQNVLETSAVLGTAVLGTPRQVGEILGFRPDSDRHDHHLWAWPLSDVELFDEPRPWNGAQGFWNITLSDAA